MAYAKKGHRLVDSITPTADVWNQKFKKIIKL